MKHTGDETTGSTPNLQEVALSIRSWLTAQNLMRLGSGAPPPESPAFSGTLALSDEATTVLEKQKVTAVGFNRAKRKIFIYTNRVISNKSKTLLPHSFCGDYEIDYRQAKPVSIDPEGTNEIIGISPYTKLKEAYTCGSSIGVGSVRMAGTLGCLVRDRAGTLYGLTNNHVTGGCNNTRVGMPIVAPGIKDVTVGGEDPFTLGHHHGVLTLRQGEPGAIPHRDNTDAALFAIACPDRVSSRQGTAYDTPASVLDPCEDMVVEKVGRTTGHTQGIIESELTGSLPVAYKTTSYHSSDEFSLFVGTVHFEPAYLVRGNSGPFSLGGDSGSLVTTLDQNGERHAIGLVFAGTVPDVSYILPLRPILERFGVSLVTGHNADLTTGDGGDDPGDS